jgi:acyl-CoA synthetase (AMP-forming)/AMP-acid ligase II
VAHLAAGAGQTDNRAQQRHGTATGSGCLPSVLRVLVGGGGMRPRLVPMVRRLFPQAVVSGAYGMTEAASSITFHCVAAPMQGAAGVEGGCGPFKQRHQILQGSTCVVCGGCDGTCNQSSNGGDAVGQGGACVGVPAPGVQVVIAVGGAPETGGSGRGSSCLVGGEAGPAVVGEVLTRGPHVMSRYWADPEQTQQVGRLQGGLRTGSGNQ